MLPEEQELIRLEREQAELEEQVASAELALETIRTETAQFQHRYYQAVGRLYAQLDELDALIARLQAGLSPDDAAAQAHARAAEEQAKATAEEAGLIEAQPAPPLVITPELKLAFRGEKRGQASFLGFNEWYKNQPFSGSASLPFSAPSPVGWAERNEAQHHWAADKRMGKEKGTVPFFILGSAEGSKPR